jgi:hypothetical protein
VQGKLDRLVDNGTLRKGDIDGYTMEALENMPGDLADCAVSRFCEANFGRITNKSGFLMGIIRRVQVVLPIVSHFYVCCCFGTQEESCRACCGDGQPSLLLM